MVSKTAIIINVIFLTVFITGLAASVYGLGKEDQNKASERYLVATAFTSISTVLTLVAILCLMVLIALYSSETPFSAIGNSVTSGPNRGFSNYGGRPQVF
jgi:uncharacterized membrane protein YciS (DUF1049 family)